MTFSAQYTLFTGLIGHLEEDSPGLASVVPLSSLPFLLRVEAGEGQFPAWIHKASASVLLSPGERSLQDGLRMPPHRPLSRTPEAGWEPGLVNTPMVPLGWTQALGDLGQVTFNSLSLHFPTCEVKFALVRAG